MDTSALRNLQKMVNDRGQLRYMTGEWFYEIKQSRHQDRIHGSEIIRASMRHSHRPLTICEGSLSCMAVLSCTDCNISVIPKNASVLVK